MSREVELGCESWTSFASSQVVPQQQRKGHCPCDSAQSRQLKQQMRSALVAGPWRGDTALTLPLFWRRSTVSPVFFGRFPRSSLHSFVPSRLHPHPVPNKPPRFCGRKAKWSGLVWSVRAWRAATCCAPCGEKGERQKPRSSVL